MSGKITTVQFWREVDYRLAKWLLLNLQKDEILNSEQVPLALNAVAEYYTPPFLCVENLKGPIGDGAIVTPECRSRSIFGSRLVCGLCGEKFCFRVWHSTVSNDVVWQCPGRVNKRPQKCMAYNNLYDAILHYAVHQIAMLLIYKRGIEWKVEKAVNPILEDGERGKLHKWLMGFHRRDIWGMQSDEDDLSIIIQNIVVMGDGSAEVYLIDGSIVQYQFPQYQPSHAWKRFDLPVETPKASTMS